MRNNRSRTENSMLNMLVGVFGLIINLLISFACRIVFTRYLSQEYLGLSSLISNFLSLLSLTELGIGSAIIYALYKPIADNDEKKIASLIHTYKTAYSVIGLIIAMLGIASLPLLTFIVGDTSTIKENIYLVYSIFLFSMVFGYFFTYRYSLLIACQKNYIVTGLNYLFSALKNIGQIIVLIQTRNYLLYLIVHLISNILNTLVICFISDRMFPFLREKADPLEKEERNSLFVNIKRVTVYKLSGVLVNHTDNLVLTYFSGLGITGLASNYVLLVNTLQSLVNQVFDGLTASVGNLNAKESVEKQYALFNSLNLVNFWAFGWAAIGITFVSTDLVVFLFGAEYVFEFKIPLMLAINLYMVGMQNAIWTFKNTKGMFKYGQYILLVTAALNIIGDIVLGKFLGVFGIYLATALARLFTNTWYEPYAVFKFAFNKSPLIYLKRYLTFLIVLILTGGICGVICSFVDFAIWANVILKFIVCSIIPNVIFYLVYHSKPEFEYIKILTKRGISKLRIRFRSK